VEVDWGFQGRQELLFASKVRPSPADRAESIGLLRTGVLRDRINEVHTVQKPKLSAVKGLERPLLTAVKADKTAPASRPTGGKSFCDPSSLHKQMKQGSERATPKAQLPAQTMTPDDQESPSKAEDCLKLEEFSMTADEEKVYGKRFIGGYERVRLLGRGGQALVWLGRRVADQKLFAVKQIALSPFVNEKAAMKEVELSEKIFEDDQEDLEQLVGIGKKSIVKVVECRSSHKDVFLVLDLGGPCLSKLVYSMKGEFVKSERVYGVAAVHRDHAWLSLPREQETVPRLPQAGHTAAGRTALAVGQEHRALRLEAREHPHKVQA